MQRIATALTWSLGLALLASCGGSGGGANQAPTSPAPVSSVAVSLGSSTLGVGQTTSATAVLRDSSGNTLSGRTIVWMSGNPAIASVAADGTVSALAIGSTSIIASCEGQAASASVHVVAGPPAPVETVGVVLGLSSLTVGQTTQGSATLYDGAGNTLPGRNVTWASSNAIVASVDAAGIVTGLAVGTATISATSEGKTGSALVSVAAPPPVPVASVQVRSLPLRSSSARQRRRLQLFGMRGATPCRAGRLHGTRPRRPSPESIVRVGS
jgi:uncharacterized protein YjdB